MSASTSSSSAVKPETPSRVIGEEDFEPVSILCDWLAQPKVEMIQENPNEILVGNETNLDEHVARACGLLEVSASSRRT